ncbi:hypothetical protein C8T65DRAFT_579081 [Cerioporus squamosus]|nr:hypothetical protein C8T65DRAFT_579081 [Cerioporus squamosus]
MYVCQDRPLLMWIKRIPQYLAELLRLEGRGEHATPQCVKCGTLGGACYRCEDCCNVGLHCQDCMKSVHAALPLHRIRQWKDGFFQKITLKELGLRVQLGHDPGDRCFNPKRAFADDFVVLDVMGIHEVGLDFCGCDKNYGIDHTTQLLRACWYPATCVDPKTAATFTLLEHFHVLSLQSKVSGWEFYTTLSRRSDNTGTKPVKDRYPAFMTMVREWRHLKLLKRSGRGHDPGGPAATTPGSCVVECAACPQPGKNLPEGWENAPAWKRSVRYCMPHLLQLTCPRRWLYQLYLSLDANFRLKRRKVSTDENDPTLNNGCSYIVSPAAYKDFLTATGNIPPEKHTHCNNHNAVKLANLKNGATLAATGVGAVDCARHGFRRPCSVGDLQKGERYANMDYLLHFTLLLTVIPWITATYDIACQFGINLFSRFREIYGFDTLDSRSFRWAIPKFHINAHREYCRSQFSLHYLPLLGRYDGEGIERNWSENNKMAPSTKEMGPGSRSDGLDDSFGHQNWSKTIKFASTMLNKIKLAVPQRNTHAVAFQQYNAALPQEDTAKWTELVTAWEGDPSKPNPFMVTRAAISEPAIRKKLLEDDAEALRLGKDIILHEDFSSSTMLSAGIDLEEQQREHAANIAGLHAHATDNARAKVLEKQNTLHRKLLAWFKVQQLFIPGVPARRTQLMTNAALQPPHKIPLLLPSHAMHFIHVDLKLLEQEWALREAQAYDALADIRGFLELRCHLYQIKDRWVRGQGANTRAMNSITGVQYKIDMAAQRYRTAHTVLTALSPRLHKDALNWRRTLRFLEDADLRHVSEEDDTTESTRTMSWIWKQTPSAEDIAGIGWERAQGHLQDSLRVEWCKARARAHRWNEECELLQEEMRRVIQYHDWAARTWEARANAVNDADADTGDATGSDFKEGARAYALRQAAIRKDMKASCAKAWKYVPAYVSLSTETGVDSLAANEAIVPAMSAAPTVHSRPSLVPAPSADDLTTLLAAMSTASLPELEVATSTPSAPALASTGSSSTTTLPALVSTASSSTTTLPALVSTVSSSSSTLASTASSSTTSLPDLVPTANSSVVSFTEDQNALDNAMEEMARFLGMQ